MGMGPHVKHKLYHTLHSKLACLKERKVDMMDRYYIVNEFIFKLRQILPVPTRVMLTLGVCNHIHHRFIPMGWWQMFVWGLGNTKNMAAASIR